VKRVTMDWIEVATVRQIRWGTVRDYRNAVEHRRHKARRIAAE
jgi:hypothetical protein